MVTVQYYSTIYTALSRILVFWFNYYVTYDSVLQLNWPAIMTYENLCTVWCALLLYNKITFRIDIIPDNEKAIINGCSLPKIWAELFIML